MLEITTTRASGVGPVGDAGRRGVVEGVTGGAEGASDQQHVDPAEAHQR